MNYGGDAFIEKLKCCAPTNESNISEKSGS